MKANKGKSALFSSTVRAAKLDPHHMLVTDLNNLNSNGTCRVKFQGTKGPASASNPSFDIGSTTLLNGTVVVGKPQKGVKPTQNVDIDPADLIPIAGSEDVLDQSNVKHTLVSHGIQPSDL